MLKAIIPLGPLNLGWSARSLYQLVIDNRRQFFTNEWMCMKIECPFSCSSSHSCFFFKNEDMKRYTRNSVFGNHFIWHMYRYMYKSIHMAICNGCHIRNFDWFYQLSFFTKLELTIFWSYHRSLIPKTTWSLNSKYSLHLQTKITNLTMYI